MPIKPENMALYPGGSIKSPEWLAIREQVRLRAHDLCEECGVVNGSVGFRYPPGLNINSDLFHSAPSVEPGTIMQQTIPLSFGVRTKDGEPVTEITVRVIRIVCTVAHVDNDLVDHSLGNLRFWCQRCHLNHDRAMRKAAQ